MNNPTTRLRNSGRIELARRFLHDLTPASDGHRLGAYRIANRSSSVDSTTVCSRPSIGYGEVSEGNPGKKRCARDAASDMTAVSDGIEPSPPSIVLSPQGRLHLDGVV